MLWIVLLQMVFRLVFIHFKAMLMVMVWCNSSYDYKQRVYVEISESHKWLETRTDASEFEMILYSLSSCRVTSPPTTIDYNDTGKNHNTYSIFYNATWIICMQNRMLGGTLHIHVDKLHRTNQPASKMEKPSHTIGETQTPSNWIVNGRKQHGNEYGALKNHCNLETIILERSRLR